MAAKDRDRLRGLRGVIARRRRTAMVACLTAAIGLAGCGGSGPEPDPVGGPALMRRLTESQYRATIGDIFGPDIPVTGRFERGLRTEGLIAIGTGESGISAFSVEQYHVAAQGVAAEVLSPKRRETFVPCKPRPGPGFDANCASRFIEKYGTRLFRRPLTQEETARYAGVARLAYLRLGDFYGGLEFALTGLMVSPEFLLRIERTEPDPDNPHLLQLDDYSKATRLSYFLTNSGPDEELLRAAGAGELDEPEGIKRQVDRLIASPGFERVVRAFFEDMLRFDLFDDVAKDPAIYPAFNSDVAADAKEQTLRTITHHLLEKDGDYRKLFTTRETFLTRPLGIIYRLPVPTRNGWEKTEFPEDSARAGIHTHVSFLTLNAHPGQSSPTLRGKAIRETFLCQEVPDAPPSVDFSVVQGSHDAKPTARDRLVIHMTQPACAGCHKVMDPPGFTLENFDGIGTFRTHENEALIDASGSLDGPQFDTVEGLGQALHDHPETPRCLVERLYRFAVGRDTVWDERAYMDYLIKAFQARGYRIRDLMRTIALSENFFAIAAPARAPGSGQMAELLAGKGDAS